MIFVYIVLYVWLTLVFIWYGRYAKLSIIDKPLILSSIVFNLLFELLALIWIGVTIYFLFKNWKLPVLTFGGLMILKIVFTRLAEQIENIALYPILFLYEVVRKMG